MKKVRSMKGRGTTAITGKQRAARKRNIAIAQNAKRKGAGKKPSIMKGESTASAFKRTASNFSPSMLKKIKKAQRSHRAAVKTIKTKKPTAHSVRRWTDSRGNYRGPQL